MWTDRTEILVGREGLDLLGKASVAVVGLGGVGAVAAEMIARAGVGRITILDCDTVSETNRNRQIIAMSSTVGKRKSEVVAARLMDINPELYLDVRDCYLTAENVGEIFPVGESPDFIIDAIDTSACS